MTRNALYTSAFLILGAQIAVGCNAQIGEGATVPGPDNGGGGGARGSTSGTGGASTPAGGTGGSTGTGGGTGTVGGGTGGGASAVSTGGAGMTSGGGTGGAAGTVADSGIPCDVQTMLSNRCWSCHGATAAAAGLPSLVTRANLMASSRSDPSKTNAELAVTRMQSTTAPMPPTPAMAASASEIAALSGWIGAGYPMGACGTTMGGAGGAGGGGGMVVDPFSVPPTCTSMRTWTGGNEGSASMNPGMACVSCHASSGGEAPRYSIAGTVYPTAHEPDRCNGANGTNGAQVVIVGADGRTLTLTPNGVGNFFSSSSVAMPYQAKVVYMGRERVMIAKQTTGDCNTCHTQNGTNSAPGRILLP